MSVFNFTSFRRLPKDAPILPTVNKESTLRMESVDEKSQVENHAELMNTRGHLESYATQA